MADGPTGSPTDSEEYPPFYLDQPQGPWDFTPGGTASHASPQPPVYEQAAAQPPPPAQFVANYERAVAQERGIRAFAPPALDAEELFLRDLRRAEAASLDDSRPPQAVQDEEARFQEALRRAEEASLTDSRPPQAVQDEEARYRRQVEEALRLSRNAMRQSAEPEARQPAEHEAQRSAAPGVPWMGAQEWAWPQEAEQRAQAAHSVRSEADGSLQARETEQRAQGAHWAGSQEQAWPRAQEGRRQAQDAPRAEPQTDDWLLAQEGRRQAQDARWVGAQGDAWPQTREVQQSARDAHWAATQERAWPQAQEAQWATAQADAGPRPHDVPAASAQPDPPPVPPGPESLRATSGPLGWELDPYAFQVAAGGQPGAIANESGADPAAFETAARQATREREARASSGRGPENPIGGAAHGYSPPVSGTGAEPPPTGAWARRAAALQNRPRSR
ncbi:hypothetical protein [Streptomyces sp. NPDC005423]|uniref:hypothetical protein n=1 Tax=Streptomyces sp. NPDC005423 TaxID=3155343 RepID=UPI0033A46473